MRKQGVELARKGFYKEALEYLSTAAASGDLSSSYDYITVLSWSENHKQAVEEYEKLTNKDVPIYVKRAAALSYKTLGNNNKAAQLYNEIFNTKEENIEDLKGLAYSLSDSGKYQEAVSKVKEEMKKRSFDMDLMLLLADLHWRNRDIINAKQAYEKILQKNPLNKKIKSQYLQMLSDLGAVGKAEELSAKENFANNELTKIIKNNIAAKYIRWNEPENATNILYELIKKEEPAWTDLRSRFDMILAFHKMKNYSGITNMFEQITQKGISAPFWVTDAAASAYLYFRKTDSALLLYQKAMQQNSSSFNIRSGLFSTLIEKEHFHEAGNTIKKLEKETPPWRKDRGVFTYNWDKQEAVLAIGWWLAYQDRLAEAEKYFKELAKKAPANPAVRSAIAQINVWQGKPRLAIQEIQIITNEWGADFLKKPPYIQEKEITSRNTLLEAMIDSHCTREAKALAERLINRNPYNTHTARLLRQLDNNMRTRIDIDFVRSGENPGADEDLIIARLTQPIMPELKIIGDYTRRSVLSQNDINYEYERIGAGMIIEPVPDLTLETIFSDDVDKKNSRGGKVSVEFRPDDFWTTGFAYDSFAINIPLRARTAGINGKKTDAFIMYRSSDCLLYTSPSPRDS